MAFQSALPIDQTELSQRVGRMFASMCEALPADETAQLAGEVAQHLAEIRNALRMNEFLDIALAEQIAGALTALLAGYEMLPEEHKALVVGATRYFVATQDAESDLTSVLGCDDDAEVLNYVLDFMGREDMKVEL